MSKMQYFSYLILFFACLTQAKAQDSVSALAYPKNRVLFNSDMSLLLRDSDSHAVDIYVAPSLQGASVRFRISSVQKGVKHTGGSSGTQIYYQGELLSGIAHLLNTNMLYVKTKGKIPNEHIYYYGARNFLEPNDIQETISTVLMDKYKFRVSDIEDTCEVWKVQKLDTTKFVLFNPEKDEENHGCGPNDAGTGLACIGYPLSFVYSAIEWKVKIIVIGDEYDSDKNHKYNFNIPYALMSDLDGLNKLLEERYGIKFIKTKVRQKLKLIEFED
jgi:hypothetical protein